jgi:micrococcal nuclease
MKKLLLTTALVITATIAQAQVKAYDWKVLRVVDGDTLEIDVSSMKLPPELGLKVRVLGVDTPEKGGRAKCPSEAALAVKATDHTKKLVEAAKANNTTITFSKVKWDKFGGRINADVMIGDVNLAKSLIAAGLAREYYGEEKKSWCE